MFVWMVLRRSHPARRGALGRFRLSLQMTYDFPRMDKGFSIYASKPGRWRRLVIGLDAASARAGLSSTSDGFHLAQLREPPQRVHLDLPHPLARQAECLPDL